MPRGPGVGYRRVYARAHHALPARTTIVELRDGVHRWRSIPTPGRRWARCDSGRRSSAAWPGVALPHVCQLCSTRRHTVMGIGGARPAARTVSPQHVITPERPATSPLPVMVFITVGATSWAARPRYTTAFDIWHYAARVRVGQLPAGRWGVLTCRLVGCRSPSAAACTCATRCWRCVGPRQHRGVRR